MSASGMPRRTVKKMLTTSPMLDETGKAMSKKDAEITRIGGARTKIADKLLGVIVYQSTLLYGFLYGGEVVISQYHVGSKLGNICAASHCHTNIGLFQRRCIIYAITGL
jgi:hypothetical protein